jgi:hypothetical protein
MHQKENGSSLPMIGDLGYYYSRERKSEKEVEGWTVKQ